VSTDVPGAYIRVTGAGPPTARQMQQVVSRPSYGMILGGGASRSKGLALIEAALTPVSWGAWMIIGLPTDMALGRRDAAKFAGVWLGTGLIPWSYKLDSDRPKQHQRGRESAR
jgi:hypothetical protein